MRQIRLDVIHSDLVDAVEINKTLSANLDADGIGGSVNLRTKTASEQPAVQSLHQGRLHADSQRPRRGAVGGTFGQRFGDKKKFGILVRRLL